MILGRRRLFWRVYVTLLISLVVVALIMAGLWRMFGSSAWERFGALRIHMANSLLPPRNVEPPVLTATIEKLGHELGADIAVFGPNGELLSAYGAPIPAPEDLDDLSRRAREHIVRLDLADGRVVLGRLKPPPPEPLLRLLILTLLVAGGVGIAAYPATARLTRRLEDLRSGVESWGAGTLSVRVVEKGEDEVAQVARSFNAAASRVEALVASQKALLANASHELRSPLTRLRMGIELWSEGPSPAAREAVAQDLAEIDQLVEEILLASRLDHTAAGAGPRTPVDLLGLAAEEAARIGASADGTAVEIQGDATLLRRLLRNLLENASKHGAPPIEVEVAHRDGQASIAVLDRGAGIPESERERVFEPFYRPAGRSEAAGGWGLGLSLVRQIARHHGGTVRVDRREGGGSIFVVSLPAK